MEKWLQYKILLLYLSILKNKNNKIKIFYPLESIGQYGMM